MTEPANVPHADPAALDALVAEAARKSGVLWIELPGRPQPYAAWHVWLDGAACVVHGGREQPLPGLAESDRVTVSLPSKDKGGLLVRYVARVEQLTQADPRWEPAVTALHAARQSPPDGEAQPERWALESRVTVLELDSVVESPGAYGDSARRATPADSPETTLGGLPRVIGRRARRNPKL